MKISGKIQIISEYLYTKIGDFLTSEGQHTVTYRKIIRLNQVSIIYICLTTTLVTQRQEKIMIGR